MLDYFDEHDLWKDTALILTTDHGFLLGEHDWWAKNRMPLYEEISHIPLFVHHPAFAGQAGTRRNSLTQTIDLMPTFCELFGAEIPAEVQGRSLLPLLAADEAQRDAAIFGYWGGGINVVDGRYTWFCYPRDMKNQDLYQYTLMPAHMTKLFTVEELRSASLVPPFAWTKGVPLLRIAHRSKAGQRTHSYHFPEAMEDTTTVLYDLEVRSGPGDADPRPGGGRPPPRRPLPPDAGERRPAGGGPAHAGKRRRLTKRAVEGSAPAEPSRPGPEPGQRPTAPRAAASRPPAVAPLPSSRADAGFGTAPPEGRVRHPRAQ